MTSKPVLIAKASASCRHSYQWDYWNQWFDIRTYQENTVYPPGTVIIASYMVPMQRYLDQGLRVIVDHLWDSAVDQTSEISDSVMTLRAPDWMWIHEYLFASAQGYSAPSKSTPTHFFLMPMNLQRLNRDWLLEKMTPFLDRSIWSYVQHGRLLPGDELVQSPYHAGTAADRRYRSEWYTSTCFSMVSETAVDSDLMGLGFEPGQLFVSEKSYKPLAYRHPFVIYGTQHNLKYLHSRGFETYGSIIDESYDAEPNSWNRLEMITAVVQDLYSEYCAAGTVFQTAQAQAIAEYNSQRFWNIELVNELFQKQIVAAIEEFVCKR